MKKIGIKWIYEDIVSAKNLRNYLKSLLSKGIPKKQLMDLLMRQGTACGRCFQLLPSSTFNGTIASIKTFALDREC